MKWRFVVVGELLMCDVMKLGELQLAASAYVTYALLRVRPSRTALMSAGARGEDVLAEHSFKRWIGAVRRPCMALVHREQGHCVVEHTTCRYEGFSTVGRN